jgi:hypothetical protein
MKINYRKLMAISGFSLDQLKRWALKLFGVDPAAVQSGGEVREFDEDEGFMVFLMGVLVSTFRIGVSDAVQYVLRIFSEIEDMGFSPEILLREKKFAPYVVLKIYPNGVYDHSAIPPRLYPDPKLFPGGVLEFLVYEKAPEVVEDLDEGVQRVDGGRYVLRCFPPRAIESDKVPGPEYDIPLGRYLESYLEVVRG